MAEGEKRKAKSGNRKWGTKPVGANESIEGRASRAKEKYEAIPLSEAWSLAASPTAQQKDLRTK